MMKKNNTLRHGKKSEHVSINGDDHDEINSLSKEIQTVILSSSTINKLKGSQPMEPNALTMRKITIYTDNSQRDKSTKVGDGAYIASEDR
jgi:hypothetical protein